MNRRNFLKLTGITAGTAFALDLVLTETPYDLLDKETTVLRVSTSLGPIYAEIPCVKELTSDSLTYYALDELTIEAEKDFTCYALHVKTPEEVYKAFLSLGLDKKWAVMNAGINLTIKKGDSITFDFDKDSGVLSIS